MPLLGAHGGAGGGANAGASEASAERHGLASSRGSGDRLEQAGPAERPMSRGSSHMLRRGSRAGSLVDLSG